LKLQIKGSNRSRISSKSMNIAIFVDL